MEFADILEQTIALLQHQGRISYGALKRRFGLDDAYLDDLKIELIEAQHLARDENGRILVWAGQSAPALTALPEPAPSPAPTVPYGESSRVERHTPEAERRQLTVLFCDLVDSTVLAGQLDPEDLREVLRAYQAACATVMAARLQGLAAPETVVLSAATLRLVQGYFTYQELVAHTLKGVAAPVPVYRILGESGVQSRLEAVVPSRLMPLVGREEEVALLQQRWTQATVGQGQVVLLSGEAGIGKSRLVQVLKEHVTPEPHTRIEWRGSAYHQQSALYPVIDHLHRLLTQRQQALDGSGDGSGPLSHRERAGGEGPSGSRGKAPHPNPLPEGEGKEAEKLRALEAALAASGMALPEVVPLLSTLLSLPLPAHYPALTLTPQRQRQKTLEALLAWLYAEAQRQPVLVIVEDLHWMDPSTMELLSLLIDQGASARLCLVLTARPEFRPPWPMVAHLTALTLRRFTPAQVTRLATYVAGDKALPPAVLEEVVRKTDGVPLFVEELTKVVLESGLLQEHEDRYELTSLLPPLAIPATLHDALMARLDRLAAAKLVAQLGAVIGRTFAYDLVQAVAPLDAATLQGALGQLVEAELVAQRGILPQAT